MTAFSGRAGRKHQTDIVHDPRPDLRDESRLWERLLARAATLGDHAYHDAPNSAYRVLRQCRRRGLRLSNGASGLRFVNSKPSPATYAQCYEQLADVVEVVQYLGVGMPAPVDDDEPQLGLGM